MKMKNNSVANKMNVEMKRHNKKATQNPAEALMRLRFLPKKPYG
jgi:hypothetical protein